MPGAGGGVALNNVEGAGGGGGIIINGEGTRDGDRVAQGYGAGGSYHDRSGQSGAVIIYV